MTETPAAPRRPGWSRRLLGLAVAVVAGLTGCIVPQDDEPRALDPGSVPFSLLATSTTSTALAPTSGQAQTPTSIYLVDNDNNVVYEVTRSVAAPGSVGAALTELLAGPSEEELSSGLTTAIAPNTALLGVDGPRDGVVTVNLSDDLGTVGGQGQRIALAQIVFTATATPGIDGVRFAFEGELSAVPDGQGQSTTLPLDRDDFATFDPTVPTSAPPSPPPPGSTE